RWRDFGEACQWRLLRLHRQLTGANLRRGVMGRRHGCRAARRLEQASRRTWHLLERELTSREAGGTSRGSTYSGRPPLLAHTRRSGEGGTTDLVKRVALTYSG